MATKHNINNYTWVVIWDNQYGEGCSQYFDNETDADNLIQDLFFGCVS